MDQAAFPHVHERYLLGELSEAERHAFEAHALGCPDCADELVTGTRFIEAARVLMRRRTQEFTGPAAHPAPAATSEVAPWRQRLWPGRKRRWIPRMAALASVPLGVLVAYQAAVVIPGLKGELASRDRPGALSPILLRPPARGARESITLRAQDPRLVLALGPMDTGPARRLEVGVQRGDGTSVVARFTVESPPLAGDPLQIVLPGAVLTAGDYEAVVQTVREQGAPDPLRVWRYPFSIVRGEHEH